MKIHGEVIAFYERGFGFVIAEDRTTYFLHIKSITNNVWPTKGDIVEFEAGTAHQAGKGPQALNATVTQAEKIELKAGA